MKKKKKSNQTVTDASVVAQEITQQDEKEDALSCSLKVLRNVRNLIGVCSMMHYVTVWPVVT